MPLATTSKIRRKMTIERFSAATKKVLSFFGEKQILLIFLVAGILLAFLKIKAWGFFLVFSVYVIMYFLERIWRRKNLSKT